VSRGLSLPGSILGALILKPELLELSDISGNDFPSGRLRETFSKIAELWEDGRPKSIDPILLSEKIKGDGAAAFVAGLIDGNIRLDFESFRGRIFELRRKALRIRALVELQKVLHEEEKTGEVDPESFARARESFRLLEELSGIAGAGDPARLLKTGEELQAFDIRIEWLIRGLVPADSITLLPGRGGIGKTWAALEIGKAVSRGRDFFDLSTLPRPVVYIDFENPLPVLVERIKALEISDVLFWTSAIDPRPPKIDSAGFELYKRLPAGALLIFDTLRSAHDGDENDSREMALVLGRLKELRDSGFSLLLLHHSPKSSDRVSRGSGAITDLADHILSLYRVRQGTFEMIEEETLPGPDDLFRLGTGEKTRFEPAQIFLKRSSFGGFSPAEDPDGELLSLISDHLRGQGEPINQTSIIEWAKTGLEVRKRAKVSALLRKGEGRLWTSRKEGVRRIYELI